MQRLPNPLLVAVPTALLGLFAFYAVRGYPAEHKSAAVQALLICEASRSSPGRCMLRNGTTDWTITPQQFAEQAGFPKIEAITMAADSCNGAIITIRATN